MMAEYTNMTESDHYTLTRLIDIYGTEEIEHTMKLMTAEIFENAPVCNCQCPEPESGAALISMDCPIHN